MPAFHKKSPLAKKVLASSTSSRGYWLEYGFFNFLGKDKKQLIVQTYSGGAHCCYDYTIYDLKPKFRVIYDSKHFDVGEKLIPVDINGDGIFEFRQSIMAFDYFHASHADSVFPPAVFAYDKQKGRYDFANKKFPNYVLDDTKKAIDWLGKQKNQKENRSDLLEELNKRCIARLTFLNLVYAGREKEAWKFFNGNYNFEDREDFRKDVKKRISEDVTYKSNYRKRI